MEVEKATGTHTSAVRPLAIRGSSRPHPLLWVGISAAFTAIVIQWSLLHGKLAIYPFYDDVSYFMDALERLQEFYAGGWSHLVREIIDRPPHSLFSCLLALGSYMVLGARDW